MVGSCGFGMSWDVRGAGCSWLGWSGEEGLFGQCGEVLSMW